MNHPPRRVRSMLRPLTVPASRAYGMVIAARNRRFDRGEGVQRIDRPVVSVGNITTGGTGKTPMVAWIARELRDAGHHPVIAMRGYMARSGERSDEEAEYRERLPDVPALANPDRVGALRGFLPQHPEIDCVLLDDGFQHRRLHRDLDLVLIDAGANTLHDELLPAGNLREPCANLARADAVIVTHAQEVDEGLSRAIEQAHGRKPIAWTRHAWKALFSPLAGPTDQQSLPIDWLRGKRVVTMLGIGKPASVIAQLESHGAAVLADIPCGDHERFDVAKLMTARGLCDGCDALVVTLKDWVKIEPLLRKHALAGKWPGAILVPELELNVFSGANVLRRVVVETVNAARQIGKRGEDAAR